MTRPHTLVAVSIVGPGHATAETQLLAAAEVADLVELRLDLIGPCDLGELIEQSTLPVIVTCRRPCDGGTYDGGEPQRIELLQRAVSAGADFIDLELQAVSFHQTRIAASNLIRRRGPTRLILSYHDCNGTPPDLDPIYDEMAELGPDIIKIVTRATSATDNLVPLKLLRRATLPTAAFCMGDYGTPSRVLAAKYGSFLTFGSLEVGTESAPGQLTARQLRHIYRVQDIGPETDIYGVVGNPIGHSLSPHIQNAALRSARLDAVYVPFLVDRFDTFAEKFRRIHVKGLSVTIPHKEAAAAYADEVTPLVKTTGACNTLTFKEGKVFGDNTDVYAAVNSLERMLQEKFDRGLDGARTLIVGAGGVARAIVHGLAEAGAELTVVNRTASRAEALAAEVGARHGSLETITSCSPEVIVNCTSVGMSPNVEATPVPTEVLKGALVVFDTIYNPLMTRLLAEAHEQGCCIITGRDMFIGQGARQFEIWTGTSCPRQAMVDAFDETMD